VCEDARTGERLTAEKTAEKKKYRMKQTAPAATEPTALGPWSCATSGSITIDTSPPVRLE